MFRKETADRYKFLASVSEAAWDIDLGLLVYRACSQLAKIVG